MLNQSFRSREALQQKFKSKDALWRVTTSDKAYGPILNEHISLSIYPLQSQLIGDL